MLFTLIATDFATLVVPLVQFRVSVAVWVSAMDWVPCNALASLQFSTLGFEEAVHDVALVEDQVRVDCAPKSMVSGEAAKVSVGATTGGGGRAVALVISRGIAKKTLPPLERILALNRYEPTLN